MDIAQKPNMSGQILDQRWKIFFCNFYEINSSQDFLFCVAKIVGALSWKKGKDPHPQDKIQHLDFAKDPRPLYYKTPPCVFCHKNDRSKAVFGP